jgi:ABC-type nickel/cobalt efflux system permease component RcnA
MTRLAAWLLVLLGATLATGQTRPPLTAPVGPGLVPGGGDGAEAQPVWLRGVLGRVNTAQRQLNQALSRELRRLRQGEVTGPALAVARIAFGTTASLVMAVGMGLTVSLVGILAVFARRGTMRAASSSGRVAPWVRGGLGVLGAAAIACLGLVSFRGAWSGA